MHPCNARKKCAQSCLLCCQHCVDKRRRVIGAWIHIHRLALVIMRGHDCTDILHILKDRAANDENEDVRIIAARMMLHYNI